MQTTQVEITLIVDENGAVVASHDPDIANEACESEVLEQVRRVIRLTLTVPLPQAIEVSGTIDSDQAKLVLTNA